MDPTTTAALETIATVSHLTYAAEKARKIILRYDGDTIPRGPFSPLARFAVLLGRDLAPVLYDGTARSAAMQCVVNAIQAVTADHEDGRRGALECAKNCARNALARAAEKSADGGKGSV